MKSKIVTLALMIAAFAASTVRGQGYFDVETVTDKNRAVFLKMFKSAQVYYAEDTGTVLTKEVFLKTIKAGGTFRASYGDRCQVCQGAGRVTDTRQGRRREKDGKMTCPTCRGKKQFKDDGFLRWNARVHEAALEVEAQKRVEGLSKDQMTRKAVSILEVTSDMSAFYDKEFTVEGTVKVDDYYNYGYENCKDTHYSFQVTDAKGRRGHVYAPKDGAGAKLRRLMLDNDTDVKARVHIMITRRGVGGSESLFGDLVGIGLPSAEQKKK